MPKYEVCIRRTTYSDEWFIVEAENEESAKELADDMAGDFHWTSNQLCDVQYDTVDIDGPFPTESR